MQETTIQIGPSIITIMLCGNSVIAHEDGVLASGVSFHGPDADHKARRAYMAALSRLQKAVERLSAPRR
jgi:hypothetical protein